MKSIFMPFVVVVLQHCGTLAASKSSVVSYFDLCKDACQELVLYVSARTLPHPPKFIGSWLLSDEVKVSHCILVAKMKAKH